MPPNKFVNATIFKVSHQALIPSNTEEKCVQIVKYQPMPRALIKGTVVPVVTAPKKYCIIYLLQTTSDL